MLASFTEVETEARHYSQDPAARRPVLDGDGPMSYFGLEFASLQQCSGQNRMANFSPLLGFFNFQGTYLRTRQGMGPRAFSAVRRLERLSVTG